MDKVYLTHELVNILDVSIATVRNYAKYLEQSGHEFSKKKQARLWTDTEINLIREVQKFYNNNDYPLQICFDYIVKNHQDGQEAAKVILDDAMSLQTGIQAIPPEIEYLEGIRTDTKALINMFSDFKEQSLTLHESSEDIKSEFEKLKSDNQKLNEKLDDLKKEKEQLQEQIKTLESMSAWEFWKYKRQ